MLAINSADLVALLNCLDAPIVITKNTEPEWARNFRADPTAEGRFLDGYWRGRPTRVEEGHGYVLHHVVQESIVWLGAFGGSVQDEGGRYSYLMDAASSFLLSDFGQSSTEQRELWAILKQEGPVVTYYDPPGVDPESPTFAYSFTKRRMQQANFRLAVLGYHGARCKVTGCTVPELLEGAHLRGRSWQDGHNTAVDGIPLRVDLHRAYDRGLVQLDDQHRLAEISEALHSHYSQYLRR
jgi:putative restriction endonuclease